MKDGLAEGESETGANNPEFPIDPSVHFCPLLTEESNPKSETKTTHQLYIYLCIFV